MPLQDLDKLVLTKTVIGITYPSCGGDLQVDLQDNRPFWRRCFSFLVRTAFRYQCDGCGHKFRMYRQHP